MERREGIISTGQDTGGIAWSPIKGNCQAMAATVRVIMGQVVAKQWQHLTVCSMASINSVMALPRCMCSFQALQGNSVLHQ